ncbi:uncharacterized protein [Eurosta solidaginis]|uniref:uncharacterized protein n=1 Tax=Eurosta solidaginis TaxID=178769 RepID=UPI003530CD9A
MDRNNGSNRYTPIRRAGQQHQTNSLLTLSSTNNNNHHLDNHRNNSSQYSASNHNAYSPQSSMSREPLTQHDELIRYIREAWTKVSKCHTLSSKQCSTPKSDGISHYANAICIL